MDDDLSELAHHEQILEEFYEINKINDEYKFYLNGERYERATN